MSIHRQNPTTQGFMLADSDVWVIDSLVFGPVLVLGRAGSRGQVLQDFGGANASLTA